MEQQKVTPFEGVAGQERFATQIMTETSSSQTATLTLRVAEARVEGTSLVAGGGATNSSVAPVRGWLNRSANACSAWRSNGRVPS